MKILLVEDAADIQLIVKSALGKKFDLACVTSAEDASQQLSQEQFSLLILDVELPGEDGFKLCANVRADQTHRNMPIVFMTGKQEIRDKILAFKVGADDYLVKPIDPAEFQFRIEAKMRRIGMSTEEQNSVIKGCFRVSLNEQKIFKYNKRKWHDLGLSTIEFKLLYYFLRHEEHVLSREQILSSVWGISTHVTDRVVDTYIYNLRKKLGEFSGVVQSVPRAGYKLSFLKKSA